MKLTERLDRLPVTSFHWRLLGLCGAGWILDSVDTGLIGFVVTDLIPRWSLTKGQAGAILSSGMAGLFVGSALAGTLADRLGRRPLFIATPLLFAIGSVLCALAWSPESLILSRFLLGLALGGEFPVGTALMTEYVPASQRGRLMVLLDSFWAYGSVLAALSATLLIPEPGWRVAFAVNALPALVLAFARRRVPESVRYLVLHGRAGEARATMAELERRAGVAVHQAVEEASHPQPRARLREMLSRRLAFNTLRLWVMWFSMTFVYIGLTSWLPSMLVEAGYEMRKSFQIVLWIALTQIPGYVTAALVIERWGRRRSLAAFTMAAGLCSLMFARSAGAGQLLLWGCWMSYFNMAAWGVLYAYTGEQFNTRLRGTGAGSCIALGRLGGIVSPLMTAAFLGEPSLGRGAALGLFGALLLVTCAGAWIGRETTGRSLEDLHGE
jgi:putative MFS transporter